MRPYKVKHVPTGLYWQPHKHRGSHLSKNGKIYQTKVNGVFDSYNIKRGTVRIYCKTYSRIHKTTSDKIGWAKASYTYDSMEGITPISDWVIEEIE